MSNLTAVANALYELTTSDSEVDAVVAAVEFLHSNPDSVVSPASLTALFDEKMSEQGARSLLFTLEQADVLQGESLDRVRFQAASGAAKTIHSRGGDRENDIVVTVPQEEGQEVGRSLGSLVVRFVELLSSANEEILILNPFFTRQAFGNIVGPLVGAIERGVSVTLVTRYLTYGEDDDSQAFVRELVSGKSLPDNLTLYEYIDPDEESTATIHAKMTIVDRRRAYLGTANLTHRGLHENLEVGVVFKDDTVEQLVRFTDELLDSSYLHEVTYLDGTFSRI